MNANGGLRERKKARTRAAIQEHAMRLFAEQGYQATTTEQIAAAADISPSTLFRYFPTKEDTVLFDSLDPEMAASIIGQPADATPIQAVRTAIHEMLSSITPEDTEREVTRQRLIATVPELRARALDQAVATIAVLADALATRLGRAPDDPRLRIWSGAVVGAMLAAFGPEAYDGRDVLSQDGFSRTVDDALDMIEGGLEL